jgi:hypothetical protein
MIWRFKYRRHLKLQIDATKRKKKTLCTTLQLNYKSAEQRNNNENFKRKSPNYV